MDYVHVVLGYLRRAVTGAQLIWDTYPKISGTTVFVCILSGLWFGVVQPITQTHEFEAKKTCLILDLNTKLDQFGTVTNARLFPHQAEAAAWVKMRRYALGIEVLCGSGTLVHESQRVLDQLYAKASHGSRIRIIADAVERARLSKAPGVWAASCTNMDAARLRLANDFRPTNYTSMPVSGDLVCRLGNLTLYYNSHVPK